MQYNVQKLKKNMKTEQVEIGDRRLNSHQEFIVILIFELELEPSREIQLPTPFLPFEEEQSEEKLKI